MTVQRTEALGSETYLTVTLDDVSNGETTGDTTENHQLLVRLDGTKEKVPQVGDKLTLGMRVEHVHLFDPETDVALGSTCFAKGI